MIEYPSHLRRLCLKKVPIHVAKPKQLEILCGGIIPNYIHILYDEPLSSTTRMVLLQFRTIS